MIRTNKLNRFEYYPIIFAYNSKNNLVSKVTAATKEAFINFSFCIFNGVIFLVNTLDFKNHKRKKPLASNNKLETGILISSMALLGFNYTSYKTPKSLPIIHSCLNHLQLQNNINVVDLKIILAMFYVLKENLKVPVVSSTYQLVETYFIASQSLSNINSCLSKQRKPLKSKIITVLINSCNAAQSIYSLYSQTLLSKKPGNIQALTSDSVSPGWFMELPVELQELHQKLEEGIKKTDQFISNYEKLFIKKRKHVPTAKLAIANGLDTN